jgi:hypothetical protein
MTDRSRSDLSCPTQTASLFNWHSDDLQIPPTRELFLHFWDCIVCVFSLQPEILKVHEIGLGEDSEINQFFNQFFPLSDRHAL